MHLLDPRALRIALGSAVTTLVLAGAVAGAQPERAVSRRARPAGVTCTGAVQHPITVRISALDDVRRGQVVRLKLTLTSAAAIERGAVRIVSAGAAAVNGARRAALGPMPAGGRSEHEFAVRVPASGARALVQFVVEAQGPQGRLTRGATWNLLPDGPAEHPRVTRTGTGEQVSEVEARRLEP